MKYFDVPVWYKCDCSKALQPLEGSIIRNLKNDNYAWQSSNSSPCFLLEKQPIVTGWYMVEINVTSDKEYLDASLVFEHYKTKKQRTSHPLLLISRKKIKRIVYIAASVKNILFYPAEQKVALSITSMRFVRLTQRLALKLMQKKLKTFQPDIHRSCSSLQLWRHYSLFFKRQQKSEADFSRWIEKREQQLLKQALHIHKKIKFTVIVDISKNTLLEQNREVLHSLLDQIYDNWEAIIIVNTQSQLEQIKPINKHHSNNVKYIIRDSTPIHLSDIIDKPHSYYLLIPSDCILSKYALSVYARAIAQENPPSLIYSDDDLIDDDSIRSNPRFKPDWNPDLLLSQNYIGECLVIHSHLLDETLSTKIDSHFAWIFSILVRQALRKIKVKHIPLILNHVRISKDLSKSRKSKLQSIALKEYLLPIHAKVSSGKVEGVFRITWPIPTPAPLVSIIIPTKDKADILKTAVDSILALTTYPNYEILIVDNQSKEKASIAYLNEAQRSHKVRVLEYNKPFNYSSINNYAATKANGTIIALLNNDIEIITGDWLTELVSHAVRPDIGCVGSMLYYPDDRIQHAGVIVGLGGCAGHSHKFYKRGDYGYTNRLLCTQNYSAVTGACLVLEKAIFEKVQGLNEKDLAVAFNDVDLCLKVKELGYRNLWTPWAELYHHESISRGKDDSPIKRERLTKEVNYMRDTWNTARVVDPYYSKYLTKIREDFSVGL